MSSADDDIKEVLDNVRVSFEGEPIDSYSDLFCVVTQDFDGSLPPGHTIEWGIARERAQRVWQAQENKERVGELWDIACAGELRL